MNPTHEWQTAEFSWLHRPSVNGLMTRLDSKERQQALMHALSLHPDDGFLNGHYGRACRENNQLDDAITHLTKALNTQTTDVSLPFSLGLTYRQLGDETTALKWLQQAVSMNGNADHIMVLIHTACDIGDFTTALSACETGLNLHPTDNRIQCAYPQTLVTSGDPEAALTWLEANDCDSNNALAQLKYKIYTDLNRTEHAKAAQQDYQRRSIRTHTNYRAKALATLNSLPSVAAKIELAKQWQESIHNLIETEEPMVPIHLAMSILVRDEVDIIEHNIRYHAAMGVSHFVVTDNGSKDGTRELLETLSSEFSLTIIDEPSHTIDQDVWVTRMAQSIQAMGTYDWIIHNDADEFWRPDNGYSLPVAINDALRMAGKLKSQVGILSCPRVNMIGSLEDAQRPNYRFYHNTHWVKKDIPIAEGNNQWNESLTNTVARLIPDKVMTRTEGLTSVEYGNHGAEHELLIENCHAVTIYHFPVRTFQQFEKKVKNYGESLEKNTRYSENSSMHLRYWYKQFLAGNLKQEYESIAFTQAQLAALEQDNYLEVSHDIASFFTGVHEQNVRVV